MNITDDVKEALRSLIQQHVLEDILNRVNSYCYNGIRTDIYSRIWLIDEFDMCTEPDLLVLGLAFNPSNPSDIIIGYFNEDGYWFNNDDELVLVRWNRPNHWTNEMQVKTIKIDLDFSNDVQKWRLHKNKIENYLDLAKNTGLYNDSDS